MDVDSFVAVWNRQLPQFVSWIPQPNASAVKAFSLKLIVLKRRRIESQHLVLLPST
jgi:hypothetical protein